jgi:uncharacterized protein YfaS (alpha-2-macroglobulin family)
LQIGDLKELEGFQKFKELEIRDEEEEKMDVKYILTVEGLDGIVFTETATLKSNYRPLTVLIQIDKPIYKPGDMVQFRAIVLNGDTKPIDRLTVSGKLRDPLNNVVKNWLDVNVTNSVFKGNFKLPEGKYENGVWRFYFEAEYASGKIGTDQIGVSLHCF